MSNKAALVEYGNRTRIRAGALLYRRGVSEDELLLVKHRGIWDDRPFWTPAGGQIGFGEGLYDALRREVREETGLEIGIGQLCYVVDFVRPPLHSVSLYFLCEEKGGILHTGIDPELKTQLILDVAYHPISELEKLHLLPEGIEHEIIRDHPSGYSKGARYLGTLL